MFLVPCQLNDISITTGTYIATFEIKPKTDTDWEVCAGYCNGIKECETWTVRLINSIYKCFLSKGGTSNKYSGAISGYKIHCQAVKG